MQPLCTAHISSQKHVRPLHIFHAQALTAGVGDAFYFYNGRRMQVGRAILQSTRRVANWVVIRWVASGGVQAGDQCAHENSQQLRRL